MLQAEPTYATERTPDRHTDGPAVGDAIAKWLGRRPTPSQQRELDVALERVDGPGSPFAFDEVIIIKGRRCGKTVTGFGVPLARGLAGPVTLPNGRTLPFRAVHVAQNLTAAKQRFDEDLAGPYRRRFTDETWKAAAEYKRGNSDTSLTFDPRRVKDIERAKILQIASELRILAPTADAARGAGVFHRNYDEELTFPLERGQKLTAAGRPTMAELFGQAQTWHLSNVSKEVDASRFLWHQREKGRRAVEGRRTDGVCYVEYSLPPGVDAEDEAEWPRYYPALGERLVNVPQLRRDREEFESIFHDGGAAFFAEYFGRWADENPAGQTGWDAIAEADFTAAGTDDAQDPGAIVSLGVDVDPHGRAASIFASTADGHGALLDHRPGSSDWLRERILALEPRVAGIGIDPHMPGSNLLIEQLQGTAAEGKLVKITFQELTAACFALDAGLEQHAVTWRRNDLDAELAAAAAAARRSKGRSWIYERLVSPPQSPIVSWTLALWAAGHPPQQLPDPEIF